MGLYGAIRDRVIDGLTPKQVRHLRPILPAAATGKLDLMYQQMRRDFQLVPPLTMHSQSPDLLAGIWAVVRESGIVCDKVSRLRKEAVAAAVSAAAGCPYCRDAHMGMLSALAGRRESRAISREEPAAIRDAKTRALVEWGLANLRPDSDVIRNPPFSAEEAPEIIGTAVASHYLNRMTCVFLTASPFPVTGEGPWARRMGVRLLGALGRGIARKRPAAGESLEFLPESWRWSLPDEFAWAAPSPHVRDAFAGFSVVMERAGRTVPDAVRDCLAETLEHWRGEDPGPESPWLEAAARRVPAQQADWARLVLLTAFAPEQVDAQTIGAVRATYRSDAILAATAWASHAAARRIAGWLWPR